MLKKMFKKILLFTIPWSVFTLTAVLAVLKLASIISLCWKWIAICLCIGIVSYLISVLWAVFAISKDITKSEM